MMQAQQLIALIFTVISSTSVVGYPGGAPVCTIGGSAVNNLHLLKERNPQSWNFAKDGLFMTVGGQFAFVVDNLDPTFSNVLQAQVDNNVTVFAPNVTYMKGILAILHGGDYDVVDTRTPEAIIATDPRTYLSYGPGNGCENFKVAAVIQKDASIKREIFFNMRWDTCGTKLFLDTNIVKNNNQAQGSQFYYDAFAFTAGDLPFEREACGFLGLSIFCPFSFCGVFGRLLGLCDTGPEKFCA